MQKFGSLCVALLVTVLESNALARVIPPVSRPALDSLENISNTLVAIQANNNGSSFFVLDVAV
jgi:hypothetical protein